MAIFGGINHKTFNIVRNLPYDIHLIRCLENLMNKTTGIWCVGKVGKCKMNHPDTTVLPPTTLTKLNNQMIKKPIKTCNQTKSRR